MNFVEQVRCTDRSRGLQRRLVRPTARAQWTVSRTKTAPRGHRPKVASSVTALRDWRSVSERPPATSSDSAESSSRCLEPAVLSVSVNCSIFSEISSWKRMVSANLLNQIVLCWNLIEICWKNANEWPADWNQTNGRNDLWNIFSTEIPGRAHSFYWPWNKTLTTWITVCHKGQLFGVVESLAFLTCEHSTKDTDPSSAINLISLVDAIFKRIEIIQLKQLFPDLIQGHVVTSIKSFRCFFVS